MKIVDRSLPYPLLSPLRDDVIPNRFELNCDCRSDAKFYYVTYALLYDNASLKARISSDAAAHSIHIECRDCFYRVLHANVGHRGVLKIPADDISGMVEVTGFIVSREDESAYTISGSHADYGNAKFSVRTGDVLASSRTFTFEAEKEFDPLKKVSSIMQILPGEALEGPFTIDFTTGKVSVFLAKNDYKLYGEARNDPTIASILIQGVVLPVLVAAVADAARLKEAEQPLPRWGEIIRQRLQSAQMDLELGLDSEKALSIAQTILQHPTHRFLSDLIKLTEGEGDEPQVFD